MSLTISDITLNQKSVQLTESIKDLQATNIQKVFRGYRVRKSFVPRNLFPLYSLQCKFIDDSVPRAIDGKTPVYLPKDIPEIVIKETGRANAIKRFDQKEAIRAVVREAGLYTLIVPSSSLYDEYFIEERLPISTSAEHNAKLYLSHPRSFDVLARQMVQLFQKAYIDYLVEKNKDDDHLKRIRYDNIPFIMRKIGNEEVAHIGLIDLERSSVGENIKSVRHKLFILASIFPLHANLIREESLKCGINIGMVEDQVIKKAVHFSCYYLEKTTQEKVTTKI